MRPDLDRADEQGALRGAFFSSARALGVHDAWVASGQARESLHLTPPGHRLHGLVLGLSVLETGAASHRFDLPAHALCVATCVHQGRVDLVDGPYPPKASSAGARPARVAAWGPATRASAWHAEPHTLCLGLLLAASVLPRFLSCDAARWRDRPLSAGEVAAVCRGIEAALDPTATTGPLPAGRESAPLVLEALAEAATVREAALASGLGMRTLERVCRRFYGLPPRLILRLMRLHRCCADAIDQGLAGAQAAASAGYFDQAHMARDFRDLARLAPGGLADAQASWPLRAGAQQLAPAYLLI